jgi:hypothetical protein
MTAVVDLSARFGRLLLDCPLMRMMDRGDTLWGNLDLYFPEEMEYGQRRTPPHPCFDLTVENQEPAPLSGVAGMVRADRSASGGAAGGGGPQRVEAAPAAPVEVPPFVVGIKTLIARNLPRDITVDTVRAAFGRYGQVRDVYIPKNMDRNSPHFGTVKGFALVKFATPEESAAAYQAEWGRLQFGKNKITVEFAQADR